MINMQTAIDRRRFLEEICLKSDRSDFYSETEGLGGVIDSPNILNTDGLDRRHVMRMLVTGIATTITGNLLLSDEAEAQNTPTPPEIDGSRAKLRRAARRFTQNEDDLSLLYERDLSPTAYFQRERVLVPVTRNTDHYFVDRREVPFGYALLRPFAYLFLQEFSEDYYNIFSQSRLSRLELNSLTRSVERHRGLGGNAAPVELTPHCRGCGMDFAYKDMIDDQKNWMRHVLIGMQGIKEDGKPIIDATEETKESRNFHVTVFKNYAQYVQRKLGLSEQNYARYLEQRTNGIVF